MFSSLLPVKIKHIYLDLELKVVGHDCSVNGSEIGRWGRMDYNEEEEGEWEERGHTSIKKDKGNKRVRNESDDNSGSDKEQESVQKERNEEYIVIVRFNEKEQENMKRVNPFMLTTILAKKIGDIVYAKVLNDGNLMVKCADSKQLEIALKIKEIGKCKVENVGRVGDQRKVGYTGVITGIPINVSMEELKKKIKGGNVMKVQRLKSNKEGVLRDSESVAIEFEGENIPKKVFLGFMSYPVRAYVPKPLRCYKCQRFGHTAKNCSRQRRCARCSGDHDYGNCGTGTPPKCCSCGGDHNVAYGGCEIMKKETKIQKIRVERRISYADAVKVIKAGDNNTSERENLGVMKHTQRSVDRLYVEKRDLVTFIAGVINSTAEVKSKNDKIQLVVKAAINHLGLVGLTWEEVRENLAIQSSQEASWVG